MKIEKQLLSVKEIMLITGWSKALTYKLINKNKLRAVPTNSEEKLLPIRVEISELEKLIKGVPEEEDTSLDLHTQHIKEIAADRAFSEI